MLEQLTPTHRAAQNLYQVLQEARNMCPDYRDIIDVRDRAYVIERTADLLFSGTKNSLDFIVAKRAEEQVHASHRMAAAAHRLNILAAFFFPIITLTTIFGVDVATMVLIFGIDPEIVAAKRTVSLVFPGVILCSYVAGGILTSFVNRPSSRPHERGGRKTTQKVP